LASSSSLSPSTLNAPEWINIISKQVVFLAMMFRNGFSNHFRSEWQWLIYQETLTLVLL
jgi:hypothetical protein